MRGFVCSLRKPHCAAFAVETPASQSHRGVKTTAVYRVSQLAQLLNQNLDNINCIESCTQNNLLHILFSKQIGDDKNEGFQKTVTKLLECGIDLNHKNNLNQTPVDLLMTAVQTRRTIGVWDPDPAMITTISARMFFKLAAMLVSHSTFAPEDPDTIAELLQLTTVLNSTAMPKPDKRLTAKEYETMLETYCSRYQEPLKEASNLQLEIKKYLDKQYKPKLTTPNNTKHFPNHPFIEDFTLNRQSQPPIP